MTKIRNKNTITFIRFFFYCESQLAVSMAVKARSFTTVQHQFAQLRALVESQQNHRHNAPLTFSCRTIGISSKLTPTESDSSCQASARRN